MRSRRKFLRAAAVGAFAPLLARAAHADEPARRPRVAVIYTVLRFRSHAFNFLENCLRPLLFNGKLIEPAVEVVSVYADQRVEEGDMTDDVVRRFKLHLGKRIEDALTLGTKALAVDGVLLIGEHGDYPANDLGQTQYPRKQFFDQIVAVMRRSNRFVPIFNDKHLSYRWDWAREMYDTARKLRIPLMAGSSVPLAQRRPPLEIPGGAVFEEAISIHSGGFEVYDFHGLEVLQSMVEARKGGETGIARIEFLQGDALFKAADQGRWSRRLAEAALRREFGDKVPDIRQNIEGQPTHGILVTYRDGLKATVLKVGRRADRWLFACKLAGEAQPRATKFYVGPWGNRNLFMALTNAVQQFVVRRESPYPVERTLLTTGALEAAVRSRAQNGRPVATANLHIAYQPRDHRAYREMGASWTMLGTPQTLEIRELPIKR
ncbi:MAG: hypothetical protein L0Y71_02020 [Gemmataceae bacterium]|nr:hypothetical protein [Gemmataceae bacterium]